MPTSPRAPGTDAAALQAAVSRGHKEIEEMLQSAGATE